MVKIYVLKLEDKSGDKTEYKYYIGKTNNHVDIRFNQHKNDKTCSWTTKYPPIQILETIDSNDDLDEDKITKKYMVKYGIENVRGGSYCKIELDDWMIKSLEHELIGSKDLCYNCKEKGHYAKQCPLNNKSTIELYLEDFKNIIDIDKEIEILDKVYGQIIILNHQINATDEIYKKPDIYQYENLKKIIAEYDFKKSQQKPSIYDLRQQLLHCEAHKQNYENMINYIYKEYFINDKIYLESNKNLDIKFYKLNIFNIQKKKELKNILDIYTSEDIIKQKLLGLYEKKISIIV